jgi:tetratricopeptide (TPR) repeat protein
MANAEELKRAYYDRGEFDKCLEAIKRELCKLRPILSKKWRELVALGGWCYYRKGEYETARKWFQEAGQVDFAKEGLAYLAAYIDKDDEALRKLVDELGDRVNTQNALIIRGRDPDSAITHEEVLATALRFRSTEVEVANLYHNAGRFFYHKARHNQDLVTALGLLDISLVRYGVDRNWHHRGAANFWRSKVLEALLDKRGALEAARDSLYCWTQQMIIDPGTKRHKQKWEEAVNRIRALMS